MADGGRQSYSIVLDNSQLRRQAQESVNIIHGIGNSVEKDGERIDNIIRKIGQNAAGVFAASKLQDFAKNVATVRGEFQQLEMAFTTMLGSEERANNLMSQLIKTAATTPFGMSDIANSTKQLLAYGVEAEKVNETLIRLGDIAAGLSIPINDLAFLYGTTMTQGRLFTQDLRQFMGRGIPLADELAKQFGVTKDKVGELVTEGKVGFPEVEKAIVAMTSEGSKFGGLMEAQSQTITGQISNIEDAIEQMYNDLGKKSEGVISDTLGVVSSLVDNWEKIGKALLVIISTYGAYKAAVLAVAAAHKVAFIWGEAQAFLSLTKSVTSAKDAMLLLNIATKANPLGLVLGVVAAAATAFGLFSSNVDEAAKMSQKFGEKASTTIQRINTLATTLNGLSSGTSIHTKVMGELNSIIEEYGLEAIKEGDSIDAVNRKRQQAIELIKQEAIERNRLNQLDSGQQTFATSLENAQSEYYNRLKDTWFGDLAGLTSKHKELKANADAVSTIVASIVESQASVIASKTGEDWQKAVNNLYATIADRMRKIGISEKTIKEEFSGIITKNTETGLVAYVNEVLEAQRVLNEYTDAINTNAEAEKKAADGTTTFADRIKATERRLQGASGGVQTLYRNIQQLMSQYSENTIGFTIRIGGEVPKWMNKMDIPELQRLAAYFSSLGANMKDGSIANVNGKTMTKQEVLQRGADYATAAKTKQEAADKAKADAAAAEEERKKNAKKAADEAKRAREEAEREAKMLADQKAQRNQQIAQYDIKLAQQNRQAVLDLEQERINLLKDGADKELQQVELNYKRLIEANKRREEDMVEELKDKKVLEWKNASPKASTAQEADYRNSLNLTAADLPSEQQAQLQAYTNYANQIREKGNRDALATMLSDVLTYEQQRAKIEQEYAEKRNALYEKDKDGNVITGSDGKPQLRQGVTQGNLDELDRQLEEALQSIDEQFASREETYQAWCEYIGDMTIENLQNELEKAEKELSALKGSNVKNENALATARAKVAKATKEVKKANAKNDVSPKKRSIKEWEDLYSTLNTCCKEFEQIGDTVGGVAGEIISTAGQMMTSTLSMINGIVQLANMSATAIKGTSTAGATAIQTMEKASIILTIISTALQVAMAIVNLFNDDESKQKEIESLQERIDQLQWELDHADVIRLQKNTGDAIQRIKETLAGVRTELVQQQLEIGNTWDVWRMWYTKASKNTVMLQGTVDKLADAYAKMSYTADKALGESKYADIYGDLKNISQQQILIQEQIENEREKKDVDDGQITEWEQKIQELTQTAVSLINDAVEDIIGGSAQDIANDLADSFVEAFMAGEDAAQAWGDKVNEIVADIIKKMLVQQFLEDRLGEVFNAYKQKWFKNGQWAGTQAVIESMSGFAADLKSVGDEFAAFWDALPDSVKNVFTQTADATEREASEQGIAQASQESVDELNGRATAIQSHTYSISENTKLLVANTTAILTAVMNIDRNTDGMSVRMERVESNVKEMRDTLNDISLKGIKLK